MRPHAVEEDYWLGRKGNWVQDHDQHSCGQRISLCRCWVSVYSSIERREGKGKPGGKPLPVQPF